MKSCWKMCLLSSSVYSPPPAGPGTDITNPSQHFQLLTVHIPRDLLSSGALGSYFLPSRT